MTIKLAVTCDKTLFVASLTRSFRPGQGTLQRPFCLANSLGIAPRVSFAN